MLHHGDVPIGRLFFNIDLAFFDVLELDLLVFLGLGVNRRAGKGGIKRRFASRRVAIAYQLQIQLRRHRYAPGIDHVVTNVQVVGSALEGIGFQQFDAPHFSRFKLDLEFLLAVFQGALTGQKSH